MQKFGEGQVQQPDPEDPQGVQVDPTAQGMQREGAAQQENPQQALQQENDEADAAPGVYPEDDQPQG